MSRLKIALSELATADADLFRASLGRLVTRLTHHWEWSELARADLVIVDMDSLVGHMAWLKAQGAGKQVITFARSGTVRGSDLVLGKPLNDDAFAAVLEQAARAIDTSDFAMRGTEQSIPPAHVVERRPAPVRAKSPPLQQNPQHVAAPAAPRKTPISVMDLGAAAKVAAAVTKVEPEPRPKLEPDPVNVADMLVRRPPTAAMRVAGYDLIVDPERDVYYAGAALKPLKEPLERDPSALQVLGVNALATARQSKPQPMVRLRWFAGLVATPGVLVHGLREGERYKLTRWPQTEREFPRHFRIATAMMTEAAIPANVAKACGLPLAEVIDYINASRAAGWLSIERDEPPPVEEEVAARGPALLSRFRKPFGR